VGIPASAPPWESSPAAQAHGGRKARLDRFRLLTKVFEQSRVEAAADLVRQWHRFGVAENLDRLARGIHHQPAVYASREMLFEIVFERSVHGAVEVAR
jgi:hypothetical protein